MGIIRDNTTVEEDGELSFNAWIEWKHEQKGFSHCETCLTLDKCWFHFMKKPALPQHRNCHCRALLIKKPIPNVTARAECSIRKFRNYIFVENTKKELFELLGFRIEDSEFLKAEYEKQAVEKYCEGDYTLGKLDEHGQRISISIVFHKKEREKPIVFVAGWMVNPHGIIVNTTPLGG